MRKSKNDLAMQSTTNEINFQDSFETIAKSKNLDVNSVIKCLKESIASLFDRIDPDYEYEINIEPQNHVFDIKKFKEVVPVDEYESFTKSNIEAEIIYISVEEAKLIDPSIELYDEIQVPIYLDKLNQKSQGAITSQFFQSLSNLHKNSIYEKYKNKIGTSIRAKITSKGPRGYNLHILEDNVPAFMPKRYINPRLLESTDESTEIEAYIESALENTKHAQVILSTVSKELLIKELQNEIPEIQQGIVEIKAVARNAGTRAKVAIAKAEGTSDSIDEFGAIIGDDGSRILAVTEKLDGEKIDLVKYSENKIEFIVNAFSPARIVSVMQLSDNEFDVIVPDSQLTLAIGSKGVNVTLVVELVNAKLNIIKYSDAIINNPNFVSNGNVAPEELEELNKVEYRQPRTGLNKKARFQKNTERKPREMFDSEDFDAIINEIDIFNNVIKDEEIAAPTQEFAKEIEKVSRKSFNKEEENVVPDFSMEDFQSFEDIKDTKSNADDLKAIERSMANFTSDKSLIEGLGDIDLDDIDDEEWD